MLLFGESDTVSHHFWMFYDEDSPRHPTKCSKLLRQAIPEIYIELDRALGDLIEQANPDLVCICSDHGFGGAGEHVLYLNRYLEKGGWLRYARDVQVQGLRSGTGLWDRMRGSAVKRIPARLQGAVFRKVPKLLKNHIESQSRYGNIDFSRTKAISDEMNYAATIRLNLPAELAGPSVKELREFLLDWRVDGHQPIAAVHHRDELYWGEHISRSPELILEMNLRDGYSYTLLPSQRARVGSTWRTLENSEHVGGKGLGMNGSHRQHGVLILSGSGLCHGAVQAGMSDIAPSILHAMGEAVPRHVDGKVLQEVFSLQKEVQWDDDDWKPQGVESDVSREEVDAIRQRLQGLGYL